MTDVPALAGDEQREDSADECIRQRRENDQRFGRRAECEIEQDEHGEHRNTDRDELQLAFQMFAHLGRRSSEVTPFDACLHSDPTASCLAPNRARAECFRDRSDLIERNARAMVTVDQQ